MPVLSLVCHLTLVHPDVFATRVAILGKHTLEARATVGPPVPHDIPLSTQLAVAFQAAEMLHVPTASLGFRAFVCENDLWEDRLGIIVR